MRHRLKRLDFVYQHFPTYFVTACTANRQRFLSNERIHLAFKQFGASGAPRGAWIGAYIPMPDHLYLFVAINDPRLSLPRWIKSLKGTLSPPFGLKAILLLTGRRDFSITCFAVPNRTQKSGITCEITVRAELVKHWEEWPYLGQIFRSQFLPSPPLAVAAGSDRRGLDRRGGNVGALTAPLQIAAKPGDGFVRA